MSVKPNSLGKRRPSKMDKAMGSPGLEGGAKFTCKPLTFLKYEGKHGAMQWWLFKHLQKSAHKYRHHQRSGASRTSAWSLQNVRLAHCTHTIWSKNSKRCETSPGVQEVLVCLTWAPAEPCWWWPASPSLLRERRTAGSPDASSICGRCVLH